MAESVLAGQVRVVAEFTWLPLGASALLYVDTLRANSFPSFLLDVESQYPKELGRSLGLSNDTFSLRIKNATSQNSGTYKCTLGEQRGENSLSSTVTLKVTGCAGIEDEKLKKHRAELFMLTCLGIFYLLLIFFTCVRFAQDRGTGPWDPFPTYSMCWHDGQVQVHLLFAQFT
uniref:CD83 molecule n=1 Tax=Amazona collaria TaxID=241587 RepID=A0A8B9F373_9PSIT